MFYFPPSCFSLKFCLLPWFASPVCHVPPVSSLQSLQFVFKSSPQFCLCRVIWLVAVSLVTACFVSVSFKFLILPLSLPFCSLPGLPHILYLIVFIKFSFLWVGPASCFAPAFGSTCSQKPHCESAYNFIYLYHYTYREPNYSPIMFCKNIFVVSINVIS